MYQHFRCPGNRASAIKHGSRTARERIVAALHAAIRDMARLERGWVRHLTARCVAAMLVSSYLLGCGSSHGDETWSGEPGVHHSAAPGGFHGPMVHRDDGSIILFSGKQAVVSEDSGRSWSEPFELTKTSGGAISHNVAGALKLKSGKIATVAGSQGSYFFMNSSDGGRTFAEPVQIRAQGMRMPYYRRQVTQLKSGRIVVPFYEFCGRRNYEMTFDRAPFSWSAMCFSYVAYSDDDGKTWQQSVDDVIIVPAYWTEGYTEAFSAFEEPTAVELDDGQTLMIGRNRMGRLFQSVSSDSGAHWSIAEPTELAASYAPAEMRRIPSTGDLLICWNQISKDEIVGGLNRHRLTVAISVDEGKTWGNFKNLYSLDDFNYVRPDPPQMVVPGEKWVAMIQEKGGSFTIPGRGSVGTENVYVLPEDRSRYHRQPASIRTCYPLLCITDKEVLVVYQMGVPEKMPNALDIFPIEWLYDPIVPSGPHARVLIDGKQVIDVDATVEDGTLFGWGDVLGGALSLELKRTRVPVVALLKAHGADVPEDGWDPDDGPAGTLRAITKE